MGSSEASQTGAPGKVVVAVGDEQSRSAVGAILSQPGMEVSYYDPQCGLSPFVARHSPEVLLLDADLPKVDTLKWLAEAQLRRPATPMAIILLCGSTCDKARLQEYVRAGVTGIVLKPPAREALLQRVLDAMKKLRQLGPGLQKASGKSAARPATEASRRPPLRPPASAAGKKGAHPVAGSTSLLEREVLCPFHEGPGGFNRCTLRTGKIVTETSFFDIPVYVSASKGADFVNYHLLNVAVCPHCLFASNNGDYFIQPGDDKHQPYAFKPTAAAAVAARAEDRRKMAAGISPDFFNEKRTPEDAIISYELALESSRALCTAGKREFAVELVRMANYQLRVAQLREVMKLPVPAGEDRYTAAFDLLKEAFQTIGGPNLYRTIFQLVAVAIHLGRDGEAMRYLEHVRILEREGKISKEDTPVMQRYANRCRRAWEDRELHRASPAAVPSPVPAQ